MKLYACLTPSHTKMFERHFMVSLPKEFRGRNLVVRKLRQKSKTGEFASAGFFDTCFQKVEFVIEACRSEKKPFVYSDVDVRFYTRCGKDLEELLGTHDIACQWDGPRGRFCTGFMVMRPSEKLIAFWQEVLELMKKRRLLDQDATDEVIAKGAEPRMAVTALPARYWSFGRNDHHWIPGIPVDPPIDLAMHHANWTKGIPNKLLLLAEVQQTVEARRTNHPEKLPHMIERNPMGATAAMARILDIHRAQIRAYHHPMPMALVLQFWKKDKHRAWELARMMADLEPEFRDDVGFFFARQTNVTPASQDPEFLDTMLYVGKKFPVTEIEAFVDESKPYPGVCFDPWASAAQKISDLYFTGKMPYGRAFFFEADGCPIGIDWINRLKKAHEETLLAGKRVTGPLMRFGGVDRLHSPGGHVNGTLIMECSFWEDHPSLRRCPPNDAWDVFLGPVFRTELGTTNPDIILNLHGGLGLSESLYWINQKETAFITSLKDGLHHHWLRKYINSLGAR